MKKMFVKSRESDNACESGEKTKRKIPVFAIIAAVIALFTVIAVASSLVVSLAKPQPTIENVKFKLINGINCEKLAEDTERFGKLEPISIDVDRSRQTKIELYGIRYYDIVRSETALNTVEIELFYSKFIFTELENMKTLQYKQLYSAVGRIENVKVDINNADNTIKALFKYDTFTAYQRETLGGFIEVHASVPTFARVTVPNDLNYECRRYTGAKYANS